VGSAAGGAAAGSGGGEPGGADGGALGFCGAVCAATKDGIASAHTTTPKAVIRAITVTIDRLASIRTV
jgi:hypothetical protein